MGSGARWLGLLWALVCARLLRLDAATGGGGGCDLRTCTDLFLGRQGCGQLRAGLRCLEARARQCHGDIVFHGTKISIETMMEKRRCRQTDDDDEEVAPWSQAPPSPAGDACGYEGPPSDPAVCGLFGDPHLKTFQDAFMTCRAKGAWPMLSSAHLAVQVTNAPVGPHFAATAITEVTVLVKNTSCGASKMYTAGSGEGLPKAFADGTTFSGAKARPFAAVREALSGRHVLITLRSIGAVVNIRRIGRYFSVSVMLPSAVVQELSDTMQLCVSGCPAPEQLTEAGAPSTVMAYEEAVARCLEYNVTDYYLDSCVFDLAATGDLTFREAAASSLKELLAESHRSAAHVLKNCSTWPCVWSVSAGTRSAADPTALVAGLLWALWRVCWGPSARGSLG